MNSGYLLNPLPIKGTVINPFLNASSLQIHVQISAQPARHSSALVCSFQSTVDIFFVLNAPLFSLILSPLLSRIYSFFDFAPHEPSRSNVE